MKLRYQRRALQQIDKALGISQHDPRTPPARLIARLTAIAALIEQQSLCWQKDQRSGVRRIVLTPYPYLLDYYVGDDEIVISKIFATRPAEPNSP